MMVEYYLPLNEARALAGRFMQLIAPACDRALIVGSIRRRRPEVRDVDLVAISKMRDHTWFHVEEAVLPRVLELVGDGTLRAREKSDGRTMMGEKVAFVEFEGFPVDLYYATRETWGGLVLIRTGSVEHNILMTRRAQERGWKLHADGTGLFDAREGGRRIDGGTEASIFGALGVPYRKPEDREVPVL